MRIRHRRAHAERAARGDVGALFSKKEFTLESLDLNDVTREVIALSLRDLQRQRMVLQSEFAEDLAKVTGDRVQLQQVILNCSATPRTQWPTFRSARDIC
jgi:signal transduction histidine kinase